MTDGLDRVDRDTLRLYGKLVENGQERQARNTQVAAARRGEVDRVLPGVFPSNWPRPVVANVLDTTARDLAEVVGRLPTIDCTTSALTTDKSKRYAAKKTKIALYYVDHSRLRLQLYSGADWFFTYAAMPLVVEPDFETQCPRFRIDSPVDAYWETDLYGTVKVYAKSWGDKVGSLKHKFPELAAEIGRVPSTGGQCSDEQVLDVVKLYVKDQIILFLPERQGLVLRRARHRLGRPPVVIAERPKWDEHSRGQFDDVMWVWLARARMAAYGLEAADKAVRAPLAVPDDVTQIAFGSDAIIRTNSPEKVRRVSLELPQSSLVEGQVLDQEIANGTRYPKARTGDIDASIITGRGVDALTSIYSTQIATAQDIIGDCLRRAFQMAFEIDQLYWPELKKTVNGTANGAPFTETYVPAKDIAGDYTISITYGFASGMDPNRLIVFLLQLQAAQAIDRDTLQRQLPFEVDIDQLQRRIDIEQIEDALKQGLFALLVNAPANPAMGPQAALDALMKAAKVVKAREGGTPITQALLDAFTPEPQPQAQSPADQMMQQIMASGGPGGPGGGGAPAGDQYAQLGAGGSPDLAMVLAGLTQGGAPNLQYNVSRRLPA